MRQGFRAWQVVPGLLAVAACVVVLGCGTRSSSPGAAGSPRAGGQTSEGEKAKENTKFTKENYDKVKDGMTEKEVTELLGPPTATKDVGKGEERTKQLTWISNTGTGTLSLNKDGKVLPDRSFANVSITIK